MLTQSYPIGRPTRVCRASGRELAPGDRYVAAMLDAPPSPPAPPATSAPNGPAAGPAAGATASQAAGPALTPARCDFSEAAWDAMPDHRRVLGSRVLAFWRGTVPRHDAKPRPLLDDPTLEDLFEQTEAGPGETATGDERARHDGLRFVLGLLMLRRRLLTVEGTRNGTMLVRPRGCPRPPAGPPLIELRDPGLTESSTLAFIAELQGETPAEAAPAPVAGGAA